MIAALLCTSLVAACAGDRVTGSSFQSRSVAYGARGMIATSIPQATLAGLDMLRAGGSAADAAIAANAVLCVAEPTGCGVGGDLFAMAWNPREKRVEGLESSGASPRGLRLEEFEERGIARIPSFGPLPISTPGCVEGWIALHARHGKLPLAKVLEPAIKAATEGVPVADLVAHYLERSVARLSGEANFVAEMTLDGRAPKKGELWRNPGLAKVLERVAREGRAGFYEGETARAIVASTRAAGGHLSLEDLAAHRAAWTTPVSLDYRGVRVWELPPPGQGVAALQILGMLERFDLRAMGRASEAWIHHFVEAKKLAFEDRARWYADPAFVDVPVAGLVSDDYCAERAGLIGAKSAKRVEAGNPALEQGDTICLAAADESGLMVSLVQSNYRGMGSGVAVAGHGFVLQNRGEMFDLARGRANTYAPGKRPFHTIIPCILTRADEPWVAFALMGGAMQPQGHAQVVVNLVDFDLDLQEAGDAPRILHEGSSEPTGERMLDGGRVNLEAGHEWEVVRALLRRGHVVGWNDGEYGGYQAVMRDRERGVWIGASESRKDGLALGH